MMSIALRVGWTPEVEIGQRELKRKTDPDMRFPFLIYLVSPWCRRGSNQILPHQTSLNTKFA